MKDPDTVATDEMKILGPFYLNYFNTRSYIIRCIDERSRKAASIWSERKRGLMFLMVKKDPNHNSSFGSVFLSKENKDLKVKSF
jgi:hypothetical protein